MRFTCDKCGRVYAVAGELSGRAFKMKCKACGQTITVQPDEPLTAHVPEQNPFVVTPVRATRVQPAAPRAAAAPAEVRHEPPVANHAVAAHLRESPRSAPDARAGAFPDGFGGHPAELRGGATVHVLSPVAEDLGPSTGGLALAVNDLFADVEPEIEEFRARPAAVPAPREPVRAAPPAPAPAPPRRRAAPVAVAALVGIVLGGAAVGVVVLRGREAPRPRTDEPVAATLAPTPVPQAEPRPAPAQPAAVPEVAVAPVAPEPAPKAAEVPAPEAQPRRESARAARERRAEAAAAAAAVEIPPEEPARPAPRERRSAANRPALAPAEPRSEVVAVPALPQPAVVATPSPAAPAQDDAPRFVGSGFRSPQLANRKCIAENLVLPEQAESQGADTITVKLAVSAAGAVSQVQVLGGSRDPRVVDAVRKVVGSCPWIPGADAEGRPTSLWVVQPIRLAR